ncbi:hypothetical protein BGX27_009279 [Mortierella sp. AM989]|nr:hypothetical protein BGX27_009279 [Mortierella sp. AM989]
MSFVDSPSSKPFRSQRARSMAADTLRRRDTIHTYSNGLGSDLYNAINTTTSPSPFDTLSSKFIHDAPEVDLYRRPTSPPLPPLPPNALDPKKEAKAQKQKKEQITLNIQATEKSKLEKQQAKLERKQKTSDYKQMYQSQFEYQQMMEESKIERRQQRSLPNYPGSSSTSSSRLSSTTLAELWSPQHSTPSNDIFHHSSRHHHHKRPLNHSNTPYKHQHLNSLSSTTSGGSTLKNNSTDDKARSLSLMSQSAKSMYDLRPWSGNSQSPTSDYRSGYDGDENGMSHGWESLMDTLHSSTITSPLNSPGVDSPFSEEPDLSRMSTTLTNLTLTHEDRMNGHGKHLLILGANGRTGIELVKQGLERNYRVTAFVRDDKVLLEDTTLRKNQNLLVVRGSPTCQADLDRCVEGQDVVINARLMANDTTINSHSQVVLNNAMKKHGVRRLIAVTSYGCLGLRNYLISTKKLFSRIFMTGILKDKVLQEDVIQRDNSSLDWTIVRPITLKDGDLSGRYWVSSEQLPSTSKVKVLTRRDLAHYLLSIVDAPEEYQAIRSIAGKPRPVKVKS